MKSRIKVVSGEASFLGCQGAWLCMVPHAMEKMELSFLLQGHESLPEDLTTMTSLTLLSLQSRLPDTITQGTRNVTIPSMQPPLLSTQLLASCSTHRMFRTGWTDFLGHRAQEEAQNRGSRGWGHVL